MTNVRLANIVGLDIRNAQHSVVIDEALIGIEDTEAFLQFCRDQKEGIEYNTKPERLDTLATRYKKKQEYDKLPHKTADGFTDKIVIKVLEARTTIKNLLEAGEGRPFSRLKLDGELYFTVQELNALATLGSPTHIIDLCETGELKAALVDVFVKQYLSNAKDKQLGNKERSVLKLASSASKSMAV